MKRYVIITGLLCCFGCATQYTHLVKTQAVLTACTPDDMNVSKSDGKHEWCEWYDSATFTITAPPQWRGTNLVVFFPSFRAEVGTMYEFEIDEENIRAGRSAMLCSRALQGMKEIRRESNHVSLGIGTNAPNRKD